MDTYTYAAAYAAADEWKQQRINIWKYLELTH